MITKDRVTFRNAILRDHGKKAPSRLFAEPARPDDRRTGGRTKGQTLRQPARPRLAVDHVWHL